MACLLCGQRGVSVGWTWYPSHLFGHLAQTAHLVLGKGMGSFSSSQEHCINIVRKWTSENSQAAYPAAFRECSEGAVRSRIQRACFTFSPEDPPAPAALAMPCPPRLQTLVLGTLP